MVTEKEIQEAYLFLRKNNSSISDEALEFMRNAGLAALEDEKTSNLSNRIDPSTPEITLKCRVDHDQYFRRGLVDEETNKMILGNMPLIPGSKYEVNIKRTL